MRRNFVTEDKARFSLPPSSSTNLKTAEQMSGSLITISELEKQISDLTRERDEAVAEQKRLGTESLTKGEDFQREQAAIRLEIKTKDSQIKDLTAKLASIQKTIKWPKSFDTLAKTNPDAVEFFERIIIVMEKEYGIDAFGEDAQKNQLPEIQNEVWSFLFEGPRAPFNQLQIYDVLTASILETLDGVQGNTEIASTTRTNRNVLGLPDSPKARTEGKIAKEFTLDLAQNILNLYEPMFRALLYLRSQNRLATFALFITQHDDSPIDLSEQFPYDKSLDVESKSP
jgi:hypothetical protein